MTLRGLRQLHAFRVAPGIANPSGGQIDTIVKTHEIALEEVFKVARVDTAPAVTFSVDAATRGHPVRDAVMALSFNGQARGAEDIARRFSASIDRRSKPTLLLVSVHGDDSDTRQVLIWAFPQEQVFRLTGPREEPALDLADAFALESRLRKAAFIEGDNSRTGMLTARVIDNQTTGSHGPTADYWVDRFLDAHFQLKGAEGTRILAKALRDVHRTFVGDQAAQDQLNALIGLLSTSGGRWSLEAISSRLLPKGDAADALRESVGHEERRAVFDVDAQLLASLLQYRRFFLQDGVVVSAPFAAVGNDGAVRIRTVDEERHLAVSGVVIEEQVRNRV